MRCTWRNRTATWSDSSTARRAPCSTSATRRSASRSRACSASPSAPTAASATSTTPTRRATPSSPSTPSGTDGVFDESTERVVLTVDQPFVNHNGGDLTFGPDGHALHRHGRRRRLRRSQQHGAGSLAAARQDAAHRPDALGRPRLHGARGQPIRRRGGHASGDLGARSAQSVALLVRSPSPATSGSPTSARAPPRRSTLRRRPTVSMPDEG